jgi:deazaflavin-dependent oxidoreductase (nitroreductase family)
MPLPRWLATTLKHTFNKLEIRKSSRPVLIHVGRSSGTRYETPLDAHPIDGGYLFIMNYGSRSDWCRNILAAGSATLRLEGKEIVLNTPRVVAKAEAYELLPGDFKGPPDWVGVEECLRMNLAA